MTHWKQRLHRMHRACRSNTASFIVIACIFLTLVSACKTKEISSITLSDWIIMLDEDAGIDSYMQQTPYFINVNKDDVCFDAVQAAVEWGVLEQSYAFDPDEVLTKEYCAYTLMNLVGKTDGDINIKDISDSNFKKQIEAAVSSGLMKLDHRSMFYPKQALDRKEAITYLQKAVTYINNREITETHTEITWNQNTDVKEIVPVSYDASSCSIQIDDPSLQEGDLIHFQDGSEEQYFQIERIDDTTAYLKEINLLDYTEDMDLSSSQELNFENAEIVDGEGEILQETSFTNHLTMMSTKPLQRTFHIGEFNVVVSVSGTALKAEVNKVLPYGSKVYSSLKLSGMHVDYQWKSKKKDVKDAYFKVKFSTNESFGLKNGSYKNLYGDFSKADSQNLLSSLPKMFVEKQDVVERSLELCKIKVPVNGAPMMNVSIGLRMNLYASGRVELSLTQNSEIGCEVKDGRMRMIHTMNHTNMNRFKANTRAGAGIDVGLNLASLRLMDVSLNAAAEASLKTSLHIYENDEHKVIPTEVGSDVVDEVLEGNSSILVCSDINAELVLYLKMNSAKSQLGKLGLTKRNDLAKLSLLPKGKTHLENFQFVSKCTRKDRLKAAKLDSLSVSKKIQLVDYSFVVHAGYVKAIGIKALPEGYTKNDLVYTSSNTDIASVDADGNVSGLQSGSVVVTVATSDKKHSISCNVLVSEK